MPASKSLSIPVNLLLWSDASRRSVELSGNIPEHYENIAYRCMRCEQGAIYTAQAQQEAMEVRKAYLWQTRRLCEPCYLERKKLEAEAGAFATRWAADRASLEGDQQVLRRWFDLLELLPYFGVRRDSAHLAMLRRLLGYPPEKPW